MKHKHTFFVLLVIVLLATACQEQEPTPPAAEATPVVVVVTATLIAASESEPTNTPQPEPTATPEVNDMGGLLLNDEGGVVAITGVVTYTNPFFTLGVAAPVVILEDQAGFVDRNEGFLMPVASQTLGQITTDFFTSPFEYSLSLPIEPQGTLRDVDHDGQEEPGVQVYAVAYWTNTFGDPFLEERDLYGGGWSTAYASTEVSEDAETEREIVGGKLLIYAPDDQQNFPIGFGEDGLLFTEDDPTTMLLPGYTAVNLDTDPFTFDRSREQRIDLIEPEGAALVDFSDLSYADAFDALVDKLTIEYAFTEYKGIDWETLRAEFRPRFESADQTGSVLTYRRALRDFAWSIPDGHVSGPFVVEDFQEAVSGGLGFAMREVVDGNFDALSAGRIIVNFITPGAPADEAGMELGAEILAIGGVPVEEALNNAVVYSAPFSTEHFLRLQQLRYATRFQLDTEVEVTFVNPGGGEETVVMTAVPEFDSFNSSSLNVGRTGLELPLEYEFLPDGYMLVQIFSFADNDLLSIQLWERLMRALNENQIPGLIIDMRQNGGGSGFLADQMAAYFFNEPHVLGNAGFYDKDRGEFYFDPRTEDRFYLPAEELRYNGDVAVLVGPNCASACEFFSYDMTIAGRAAIVGQYPTAGLGGSIDEVLMPEGEAFRFTQGRAVDSEGNIHIEGIGVVPTIQVPVNEDTLFSAGDPILEAAIDYLDNQ
jgi:C-terminal processing protease CtpA/Prc